MKRRGFLKILASVPALTVVGASSQSPSVDPHSIAKAQVGLGNVESHMESMSPQVSRLTRLGADFDGDVCPLEVVYSDEARVGSAEDKWSPRRVVQAIDELANTGVSVRVGRSPFS